MAMALKSRVCVIEDDADLREVIGELLNDAGYEVIEASNGLAGKALLEASLERLVVVLDYRLPVLDGCDLLEIVAQDEELRARHTFVMLSGLPQKTVEDCEEALDALDVPVLSKPFHIDELVEAVEQAEQRLEPAS